MDQFAYEVLKAFALTHNYNNWIYQTFRPYISKNVLEIGCGIGNMSRYLLKSCDKLIGIDISSQFLQHIKIDYPELELYPFDVAGEESLKLIEKHINTVVCINVLEHVKDDIQALQNIYNILEPNGKLLLFVPALTVLYGEMDRAVNHFRRYNKKELRTKLESLGFEIEKIFYSNFIGVFGWFLNGKILKRKKFPILQPIFFDKMVPLISKIEKLIRLPFGLNLIIIASKL